MYNLPLEIFDILLQKSYLHWIMNSSMKRKDEEIVKCLISVDICFCQRITRQRFKKAIWRYLREFYGKTKKRISIIRSNRIYLLENIQPNDELIASLVSLNCITEVQSHFIQRLRLNRDRNDELMHIMEIIGEIEFSNFVSCLRHTKQKTVARLLENGGDVLKVKVHTRGGKRSASKEMQQLHQKIEVLINKTKPRSLQNDKLITQLKVEGLEILNSQLNSKTLVVWIWCNSQTALVQMQKLHESNQLKDIFFENIIPSTSMVINVDRNQFKKTVVVCPIISISFTQRITIQMNVYMCGVTILRHEIYVLCRSYYSDGCVICAFEDQNPYRFQADKKITEIGLPVDIGSSEKINCLYVSDSDEMCIWKITSEPNGEEKIVKWLTTDYAPGLFSISSDGHLLLVNDTSSILVIYGTDAELIRSIQLPGNIGKPIHAVETAIGNFVVIHSKEEEVDEQEEENECENEDDEIEMEEEEEYEEEEEKEELEDEEEEENEEENEENEYEEEEEEMGIEVEEENVEEEEENDGEEGHEEEEKDEKEYEEKDEKEYEEKDEKEYEEKDEEEEKEEDAEGVEEENEEQRKNVDEEEQRNDQDEQEEEEQDEGREEEEDAGQEEKDEVKEEDLEENVDWMEEAVRNSGLSETNSIVIEMVEEEMAMKEGTETKFLEGKKGKSGSSGRRRAMKSVVSELTRDGQMVIHRFTPSNYIQEVVRPEYLSLDSDDQVFVADYWNDRVLLLDSDLRWNQIICPTNEVTEETTIGYPWRLCYDGDKKQLIVAGFSGNGINVYTLNRN